jgi:hypothetical protein
MYKTRFFLVKYYLPLVLLVCLILGLWRIQVPWYVPVALLPLAVVLVVILVGSTALAFETRAVPSRTEGQRDPEASVATNGFPPMFEILLSGRPLRLAAGMIRGSEVGAPTQRQDHAWQLIADGSEWVQLRGPAAVCAYGSAEKAIRLRLYALPASVPDQMCPQVEVEPAPTHGPLTLVVEFAFADSHGHRSETRTLTVAEPLVPEVPLELDTSSPGEPLPREAFGAPGQLTVRLRANVPHETLPS